jgi:hypothetical protein
MCGRVEGKYLLGVSRTSRPESSRRWRENLIVYYKSFALPAERWLVYLVLLLILFCSRGFEL